MRNFMALPGFPWVGVKSVSGYFSDGGAQLGYDYS